MQRSVAVLLLFVLGQEWSFSMPVAAFVVSNTKRFFCQHVDTTSTLDTVVLHGVVVSQEATQENSDESQESNKKKRRFMYMTKNQDEELLLKGNQEAKLMANNLVPLKPNKVKGVGGSGGFGGGGAAADKNQKAKNNKPNFRAQAQEHAKVLAKDGIVRIDNMLSAKLAKDLRDYLVDLRQRATADIENGIITDSQERFADVLLNQNRCDLKVPLGPKPVNNALHHILTKTCIRDLIEHVFHSYGQDGSQATLYELNCFMSNSGARRQLVHADNACATSESGLQNDEPIMLTCFFALQDVDKTMGPTTWLPGTHNVESHDLFYETNSLQKEGQESSKDKLLQTCKTVEGTLPRGACAVFDPRTLHCAGANTCDDPTNTRALFYVSFKNPRVDFPGCPSCSGYGISRADLTMEDLCNELQAQQSGDGDVSKTRRIDALACFP